ncbi:MAG: xylulokinase, partial [Planctomycetaceae bacterium]
GWDFSTGGVKCLAFDTDGRIVAKGKTRAEVRLPTDLYHGEPPDERRNELNLMQLEGQARSSVRAMAAKLRDMGRLVDWIAGGVSATHHTAGRIDQNRVQVRRAICWNDQTLATYHAEGLERIGEREAEKRIGGPWAVRYTLSHLVKDEDCLRLADWLRTWKILPHGPLAAGHLTGNFEVISVSSAASTGLMNLKTCKWSWKMLDALETDRYKKLVRKQLPRIVDHCEPLGPLSEHVALEAGIDRRRRPLLFPTSDDQQAGLVGGGAVKTGQIAIVLGNSAVVNSSSESRPEDSRLDVMRLNWDRYLWMRCYNNGAQFLDQVIGEDRRLEDRDWQDLEAQARKVPPCCEGTSVLPFARAEPSLGVRAPRLEWTPREPQSKGVKYRACLEAIAYLIALAVEEHRAAGQRIEQVSVSGGIANSDLMCRILASALGKPLHRLVSHEGPALGAAVTALAAMETHLRRARNIRAPYTIDDAVAQMVKFKDVVEPNFEWTREYQTGLEEFRKRLQA